MFMQNFGGTNKEYYGIFESGINASLMEHDFQKRPAFKISPAEDEPNCGRHRIMDKKGHRVRLRMNATRHSLPATLPSVTRP